MITALLISPNGIRLDMVQGTHSKITERIASWLITIKPGDKILFLESDLKRLPIL